MFWATKAKPVEETGTAPEDEHRGPAAGSGLNDSARMALRGDPFAVRQFLRAIAPIVRSVCRGVMGLNNSEIEDTIQDCLVDVVRALPQFRFEADVSHYVTKIALRRAIASRERARAS